MGAVVEWLVDKVDDFFNGGSSSVSCNSDEEHSKKIQKQLAEDRDTYKKSSEKNEDIIAKNLNMGYHRLIHALESYNGLDVGGKALNLNINAIKERNRRLNSEITGSISAQINSRLVMTDKELAEILKIREDKERNKKFRAFVKKIQRESLDKLNRKIREVIGAEGQEIKQEVSARIKEIDRSLTDMTEALGQLIENKKSNEAETDKTVSDLIYKRTLCDLILKEIGEGE